MREVERARLRQLVFEFTAAGPYGSRSHKHKRVIETLKDSIA